VILSLILRFWGGGGTRIMVEVEGSPVNHQRACSGKQRVFCNDSTSSGQFVRMIGSTDQLRMAPPLCFHESRSTWQQRL
jgi:hypothetical protein